MFKTLLILAAVLGTTPSFAQVNPPGRPGPIVRGNQSNGNDIEADAGRLALEIAQNGRYLTNSQRDLIAAQLQAIRTTLYGQGPQNPGGYPPGPGTNQSSYTCVSKDNDGRNPYVIGVRNGINVTRTNAYFTDLESCNTSIQGMRNFGYGSMTCVSKDSDGRNPWALGLFDQNGFRVVTQTVVATQPECVALMNRILYQRDQAMMCVSRDGDGRAPYTPASINTTTLVVTKGSESFTDVNACWSFVGRY